MRPVFRKLSSLLFVAIILVLSGCSEQYLVLDPKGPIASAQQDLILITALICVAITIPVFILTLFIVLRYKERPNSKATYKPYWEHSFKLEAVWWGIPIVAIALLAVITVNYTFKLEPSKALESANETIEIQVTSLDWKWLFTYPEENIATVNYVKFPADTPIRFKLTSDMAMNSFWIPSLGGQLYTMSGMAMTLHLMSDEEGSFYGSGANFSGEHFAKMTFQADAVSRSSYDAWIEEVKDIEIPLTSEGFETLRMKGPATVQQFSSFPEGLFYDIMTQYVEEGAENPHEHHMNSDHSDSSDMDMHAGHQH